MTQQAAKPTRWTIRGILGWTRQHFETKGIASPRLDAELLLAHCLKVDRLFLYLNMDRPLLPEERARYRDLVKRRSAREPVALITGKKEFWSLKFRCAPGVLIPRPDTETLVDCVRAELKDKPYPLVLEIGTGSGAVAISVATECPTAVVVGIDISGKAVRASRRNAVDLAVADRVCIVAGDLFSPFRPEQRFDVVCSNPPYIPSRTIRTLAPEIRRHEPVQALDGGEDGLDVIRSIVAGVGPFLKEGGALMVEIGDSQEQQVTELYESVAGLKNIRVVRDLAGKPRVVVGRLWTDA